MKAIFLLLLMYLPIIGSCQTRESKSYFKIDSIRESSILSNKKTALFIRAKPLYDTNSSVPILWSFHKKGEIISGQNNPIDSFSYYSFIISNYKFKYLQIDYPGFLSAIIRIDKTYRGKKVYITAYLADDTKPLN
ncbi:hypothetical protein [Siphonobacter curvatus]|uniref:Uncharacterized protein n=1 Tax=Siphonobacter curvatus TaxID=2094562 RepID=A0A2S7IF15_9BACT|nr:hypothetical protein [Siphonobacter curvatus]PQA53405.1 hypothetical protein C5O19_24475 [Siphonobacter curvatus]